MAEWSNAPVLKTGDGATRPRVRIPPPPLQNVACLLGFSDGRRGVVRSRWRPPNTAQNWPTGGLTGPQTGPQRLRCGASFSSPPLRADDGFAVVQAPGHHRPPLAAVRRPRGPAVLLHPELPRGGLERSRRQEDPQGLPHAGRGEGVACRRVGRGPSRHATRISSADRRRGRGGLAHRRPRRRDPQPLGRRVQAQLDPRLRGGAPHPRPARARLASSRHDHAL